MDAAALHRELTELRKVPRKTLENMSTKLTMVAAALRDTQAEAQAFLHVARLLYVLAHDQRDDESH